MKETIFKFDHDQKKMHKAIGVPEQYMEDLHDKCGDTLKNFIFDENKEIKDDMSPSQLVEICLIQFSYSELVLMASFFLKDRLDEILGKMNQVPDELIDLLARLAKEDKD